MIGVNLWPEETTPLYMLVPRAMFFEFIPVEDNSQEQPTVRVMSKIIVILKET